MLVSGHIWEGATQRQLSNLFSLISAKHVRVHKVLSQALSNCILETIPGRRIITNHTFQGVCWSWGGEMTCLRAHSKCLMNKARCTAFHTIYSEHLLPSPVLGPARDIKSMPPPTQNKHFEHLPLSLSVSAHVLFFFFQSSWVQKPGNEPVQWQQKNMMVVLGRLSALKSWLVWTGRLQWELSCELQHGFLAYKLLCMTWLGGWCYQVRGLFWFMERQWSDMVLTRKPRN